MNLPAASPPDGVTHWQAALRASEARYRRLFQTARDGILLLDPVNRRITDANRYVAELLGYSPAELVGKELWQIGLLGGEPASHRTFRELQEHGVIRYDNLRLTTKDSRPINVEFIGSLYDEEGKKVVQCNIRDATTPTTDKPG